MSAFQDRVVAEKAELDTKITKLSDFSNGDIFKTLPEDEQKLLIHQLDIMRDYSTVLGERIADFTETESA